MSEIAAASDEQSRGIQQVSQAVTEMDNVTQQNASLWKKPPPQRPRWKIRRVN